MGRQKSGQPGRGRVRGRCGAGEGSHPVEMLLGKLKMAMSGTGVAAAARLIELGQRSA